MSHLIRIETPDGRSKDRRAHSATLSDWLEREGHPLNTRCSGRGLCRGCLVEVDCKEQRACQTSCDAVSEVRIPEASLRDQRINGISAFEILGQATVLHRRPGIGLALDLGTTTVAAALWDLETGQCLASGSVANEQRRYGDNLLSRIDHAVCCGGSSPKLQQALVRDSLEPLVKTLCEGAGIKPSVITEALAAGNTVMQHSLLGADLCGFAAYPFTPVFLGRQAVDSADLGFSSSLPLVLAPNLGPFVGADITVGALASGMLESGGPALLIDFGTNGEILLKTRDGYLATATAVGPAFEGGRLSCGATAGQGVISGIRREQERWQTALVNSGNGAARGISGAAYIDFLYEARHCNLLSEPGRFNSDADEVTICETPEGPEKQVLIRDSQFVSEQDVAELIQAKAAIAAGVLTLLEEANLEPKDLDALYIAGGFGYHLTIAHAIGIGMIPGLQTQRIRVIGNASLGGASLLLQSQNTSAIEQLCAQCTVVELNQIASFEDHFIDSMTLIPSLVHSKY